MPSFALCGAFSVQVLSLSLSLISFCHLHELEVCEKFQERAVCYVYDVTTGKRRRGQLTYGDCDAALFEIGWLSLAILDPQPLLALTTNYLL